MTTATERMRRELRAMAAVNRQLQVQREEPVGVRKARRVGVGASWIEELAAVGVTESRLARSPDGAVFVLEGTIRRPVRSGLLAAALEQDLGAPEELTDGALDQLTEGVPVELLEATSGVPFLIIGGKRRGATGVPLTFPVEDLQASEFPEGESLNVAAANVSRRRFEEARKGSYQITRARGTLAEKGAAGTAKTLVRRAASKVKHTLHR